MPECADDKKKKKNTRLNYKNKKTLSVSDIWYDMMHADVIKCDISKRC